MSDVRLKSLFNFTINRSVHRAILTSHFRLLQSFCHSLNSRLTDSITNFYINQFISIQLLTENQFHDQILSSIEDFQMKTINSFRRELSLIINIILGNQFMTVHQTNRYFIPDPNGSTSIFTRSRSYGKMK